MIAPCRLLLVPALLAGGPPSRLPPSVVTTILAGPEGRKEAFEPSLAIDPSDPGRMAVAGTSRAITYDNPWMTIDRHESSPHRGMVYVISGVLDMELPSYSWAETPTDLAKITMLGLDFAVSGANGKTFGPVRRVADSVFGTDLAVSGDGSLEVVYPGSSGGISAIVHRRSTDGGGSFGPAIDIARAAPKTTVGGPMIAARPNGGLMACWSGSAVGGSAARLRCAARRSDSWSGDGIRVAIRAATAFAFPTLVGTNRTWYLLLHLIGASETEVALFRSDGRSDFAKIATLTRISGLGISRWCFARQCRFFGNLFIPGDYASVAASGGRIGAAYLLPRPGGKLFGRAAVYVSLLDEP